MAPSGRRGGGKPGGPSRLRDNGGGSSSAGDGDVGMAEASTSSGGPDRRRRSGRGIVNSRTGKTPYSAPSGGRPVNGQTPPALADRLLRAGAAAASGSSNKPGLLKESINIKGAVEALRQLIRSRWNAEAGLLNLENMASDPAFTTSKLKAPGDRLAPKNAAPALWKLASEMCPGLQSVSLASNSLSSLTRLAPAALVRYLPKLQNLSLQNNQLDQYADLNALSAVVGTIAGEKPGLTELKELILIGNPLQDKAMKRSAIDYQNELRRRFPSLRMLDQQPIDVTIPVPQVASTSAAPSNGSVNIAGRAKRQADTQASGSSKIPARPGQRTKAALPLSTQPAFADSDASRNAMSQFLVKYFGSYDNDRSQLIHAYVPQAMFSLCVNTTVSERTRRKQDLKPEQIAKQKELSWGTYLGAAYESNAATAGKENLSRNFIRTKQSQRREELLNVGPQAICTVLSGLPKSSHPLDDASKFVVDALQQPGTSPEYPDLLVVIVHGEFQEHPSMGTRSFDRTFVLAPTPVGTAAAADGWPCVILSDMLLLRNWTNPEAYRADDASASGSAAPVAPPADSLASLTPEQQSMMEQLHAQSRLNAQFCFQCLSETGWNLQAALQAFEAAKASIPPEAFV